MYSEDLKKKLLSQKPFHTYKSGDSSYNYKNISYLIRNEKIICHGQMVFSFPNMDYTFMDDEWCTNLMRDGKLLYKTKPNLVIGTVSSDVSNDEYYLGGRYGELIDSLCFPFNTSLLNIIDNKIKGEL